MSVEERYLKMREDLGKLSMKELKQIAKEEGVSLGYAASRKDSTVAEIVAWRRNKDLNGSAAKKVHPWKKYRSVLKGC